MKVQDHRHPRRGKVSWRRGNPKTHIVDIGDRFWPEADKRHAVMLLLNDEEWARWSDREISRKCCVDHTFVGNLRKLSLATNTSDPTTKTYTNKHG